MKELCEPADDEGFMPFIPFLERMCAAEKEIFITSTTICLYHLGLPHAAPPQQYTNDFLRLSLRGVRAGRGRNELEHSRISYIEHSNDCSSGANLRIMKNIYFVI